MGLVSPREGRRRVGVGDGELKMICESKESWVGHMCVPKLCSMILAPFCAVFMRLFCFVLFCPMSRERFQQLVRNECGGQRFCYERSICIMTGHHMESDVGIFPAMAQPLLLIVRCV